MDTAGLLAKAARLLAAGEYERALSTYRKIARSRPRDTELHNTIANLYQSRGQTDEALKYYSRTLQADPNNLAALGNSGLIYQNTGRPYDAARHYRKILETQAGNLAALMNLAMVELDLGNREDTIRLTEQVLASAPQTSQAHSLKANALYALGRFEAAVSAHRSALAIDPQSTVSISGLATCLTRLGERDEARTTLAPFENSQDPNILMSRSLLIDDADRASFAEQLLRVASENISVQDRIQLLFAAGSHLDRCGEVNRAFEAYRTANRLVSREFDRNADDTLVQKVIETTPACTNASNEGEGLIFIVGFPRSGTSLLEQILGQHSAITALGERPDIPKGASSLIEGAAYPECLRSVDSERLQQFATTYLSATERDTHTRYTTDKLPHNFLFLGLIRVAFPACRIIHIKRGGIDTCLSNYMQLFSSPLAYPYDLGHIGHHYNNYLRLMQHWRDSSMDLFETDYEAIVQEPESTIRSMLSALDLEFEDACMDFHRSERVTRTASVDQVRSELYSSSIGRWEAYREHLSELISIIGVDS